jgi:hypothetical protein
VGFDTELGEGEKIAYLPSDLHDHYRSTKRVDWRDHTRMPVILPEDQVDAWLSGEAGKEILVPYPADQMTVWPISPQVTRTRFNGESGQGRSDRWTYQCIAGRSESSSPFRYPLELCAVQVNRGFDDFRNPLSDFLLVDRTARHQ